jgi:DHA1 family bicyclomycin/chloramphenicol resistance-like MFS transporter
MPSPGRSFSFALALVALIVPLAVHLFLPAIPAVKAALGLNDAMAQLTFSVSLFAMAFATLAYGSLSDRYGRRPVLPSGLALFLIGSVVSAFASDALTLVLGRLLQAVGAGCGMTLVRTIARDAYPRDLLVRVIAYLTMFYTLGPMISPLVGGLLIDAFGWRSVFAFALIAGAAIALSAYVSIYETHPPGASGAGGAGVWQSYRALLGRPRFVAFVLQSGFSTGAFMTMAVGSATLMKEMLQRPSAEYGLYFILFPVGFFLGNFVASRVGNRASGETMVLIGSLLSLATVVVQALVLTFGSVTPLALFLPGLVITMAQGIALPYAQVGAMNELPQFAGTAAGGGVFVQNFCGAVFAQLYGLLADGSAWPMVTIATLGGALCFLVGAVPFVLARRTARTQI